MDNGTAAKLGAAMAMVALTAGEAGNTMKLYTEAVGDFPKRSNLHLTDTGNWRGKPWAVKAGRNEVCPCGSGKKFKKCCYGKVAS